MIKRMITLLLIVLFAFLASSCNEEFNMKESIKIKKNEVYDWRKIVDDLENCLTPEVFVRLVDYTMNNNLRIKPGRYEWDKDVSFEKARQIFDFASVEEPEGFRIVKQNTFSIDENEVFDWQKARDNLTMWLSNRAYIKVIEYMKDNNMKIASGEYLLKQNTNYDDAMAIFEFDKIIHLPLVENQKSINNLGYLGHKEWIEINQLLYFWLKPEDRINLMVYMYKGDFLIKPGKYIMKQDMEYDELLQLFEFTTMD